MKLLVVDDSPDVVEVLSIILKLSGHGVDEACNGIEAVRRLQENSYDVVITDAQMPGMGGVEVCNFLKMQFPDVYIIGISGSSRGLKELKDAGAHICLAKPFQLDELEEAVENRVHALLPGSNDALSHTASTETASASL
ncbi:MAG: response regulator [Syntrophales bacterium]|jgi:CheY-like chemotaxis protein